MGKKKMNTDKEAPFNLIDLKTGKNIRTAMQSLFLTGEILPVGARLSVWHVFKPEGKKPVEAIYCFALPRDASMRRFFVKGDRFSAYSRLEPTGKAVKAYEKGVEDGHLSLLARQYRDGIVNLSIGNVRPGESVSVYLELIAGVDISDQGLRFRFPFALAPGYHGKAKMMEVGPGAYELELPEDEFGDLILPQWRGDTESLHSVGFDLRLNIGREIAEIASPSHAMRTVNLEDGNVQVLSATDSEVPDRDLVLDVRTRDKAPLIVSGVEKDGKGRFAVVVSSENFGKCEKSARNIVFVIDRSGSMSGLPMAQARKAVEACLGALGDEDRFGIVAFDDMVERFSEKTVPADMENRTAAKKFLEKVDARGGTELLEGLEASMGMLGGTGGDIMVITDGEVFGTEDILMAVKNHSGIRIHCLGIGSASQDRFLALLARESSGRSRFVTPRERVDIPAIELFSSISRPVARNLQISTDGNVGLNILNGETDTVFQGSPLVLFGDSEGNGEGSLIFNWDDGAKKKEMVIPVVVKKDGPAETLRLIYGARLITDMDVQYIMEDEYVYAEDRRHQARIADKLKKLSKEYGLASKVMSLVAVVRRDGDEQGSLPETMIVPVGMPNADADSFSYAYPHIAGSRILRSSVKAFRPLRHPSQRRMSMPFGKRRSRVSFVKTDEIDNHLPDILVELAARIQPDGGMPGKTEEYRIANTIIAIALFAADGNTVDKGTFKAHVGKLLEYLEKVNVSSLLKGDTADWEKLMVHIRQGAGLKPGGIKQVLKICDESSDIRAENLWDCFYPQNGLKRLLGFMLSLMS